MHHSQGLHGSYDADTGCSVDASLLKVDGRPTNILVEFPGGTGEGNELSLGQASELVRMLGELLAVCASEPSAAPVAEAA